MVGRVKGKEGGRTQIRSADFFGSGGHCRDLTAFPAMLRRREGKGKVVLDRYAEGAIDVRSNWRCLEVRTA
jgi:hypothetical protein